jgi:hypothetical protein
MGSMQRAPSANDVLERLLGAPEARNLSSALLEEAERVFLAHGDAARARWMSLERDGYGARTQATNLRDVLGAGASEAVVRAVLESRSQSGRVVVGGVVRHWPHFFVESVDELRLWEERVASGGAPTIELEFSVPSGEPSPHALSFDRSVFAQILFNIALEIGQALRRVNGAE